MIPRNYDVVVVEPSPGALIAASLLARAGLAVLVLENRAQAPRPERFRFIRHGPPVVGFGRDTLLTRSLKALKFHPHELAAIRRADVGLQVITSRHRLDVSDRPEKLEAELKREYRRDAQGILRVLQQARQAADDFSEALDAAVEGAGQANMLVNLGLVRPGWSAPLPPEDGPSWGEFLANSDVSDEGRVLLRALVRPFCAIDHCDDLPLPVAGMHLGAALDGMYADPGEEHALYQLLLRRVRAMRVDVLDEKLTGLRAGFWKINEATFEGARDPMPLSFLITGGDPEGLMPLLDSGAKSYDRVLRRLAPSHFRYSVFVGVRDEVIPADLAEHCILLSEQEDPEEPLGSLLVSVSPPGSPLAPDGCRSITVTALLPYGESGGLPSNLADTGETMLERLEWLVPYLSNYTERRFVPTTEEATESEPYAVDDRPAAWTPVVTAKEDPVSAGLGVGLPHRNAFCAGGGAFPAFGLSGEALAGRLVERLAMAGKQRPS